MIGPHHLAIQVRDLAAAERFYCGVLGLAVERRFPAADGSERSLWLALDGMFVALEKCSEAALESDFKDPRAGLFLFALRIAPEERAQWEARLGPLVVHRSRWTIYFRDPDGNRLGLSHHPDDLPIVRRLAGQGIRDERVLAAFAQVPREAFVPAEQRSFAQEDRPLDIGEGQTISQPYIVALMTEALALEPGERVLEVGTGSGYQTAILASLGVKLTSVEVVPSLLQRAASVLRELGIAGVELRLSDGALGVPEQAPFDAILVAAAPAEVPAPLFAQLAPGGRLVIPVGADPARQELELWTKDAAGALARKVLAQVRFVPLVRSIA